MVRRPRNWAFKQRAVAQHLNDWAEEDLKAGGLNQHPTGHEFLFAKLNAGETLGPYEEGQPAPTAQCMAWATPTGYSGSERSYNIKVSNWTSETFEDEEAFIPIARSRESWNVIAGGGGSQDELKRVRFKLLSPIQMDGAGQSGRASAEVIDPLNSGLQLGDIINVHDPRKEFCFARIDSIGWATKGISSVAAGGGGSSGGNAPGCCTYTDSEGNIQTLTTTEAVCDTLEDGTFDETPCEGWDSGEGGDRNNEWIIETCTQLVVRVRATLGGCLSPWEDSSGGGSGSGSDPSGDAIPDITGVISESYWPYIMWYDSSEQSQLSNVVNPHMFVAADGDVWLERREVQADTQVPDGMETPYDDSEPEYEWVIVAVEKPTAKYAKMIHAGSGIWTLEANGEGDYWDGHQPACSEGARVPPYLAADISGGDSDPWCAVPAGIYGTGRLDKMTGEYVLINTFSAYYGVGKKAAIIGKGMNDEAAGDLLSLDSGECGRLNYKQWENAIVFGNDVGGSCELAHQDPDPYVDLAAYDQSVVTGLTTNAEGELELETKLVKTLCEPESGSNIPFPYTQTDIVENVYCTDGVVQKDYKQIRYIGNTVGNSSNSIALECTDINNYDWQYIFENYVYDQSWYTINYYDITYPDGCAPCPTGCCVQTRYDEGIMTSTLTEDECNALVNPNPTQDADIVSVEWTEGECTGCCSVYDGPDQTGNVIAQQGDLTEAECTDLRNNTPNADSWLWSSGYDCPEPESLGCCFGPLDPQGMMTEAECTALDPTYSWYASMDECPSSGVGCCTIYDAADQTGNVIYQDDGLYWQECNAQFNAEIINGAASFDWASGDCPSTDPCENTVVSNFQIGGLGAGMCTAQFNQVGTATITGGIATVNGTWTGTDAGAGGGGMGIPGIINQPGTITVATDGTNWSWTGNIWDGTNASGADTGTCGGTFSGSDDGSFGDGTMTLGFSANCSAQWENGQWEFSAT